MLASSRARRGRGLPDGVPVEHAVPANCAISQALAGVYAANLRLGDVVVVPGLGGLGVYATALARDLGAGLVVGVDMVPERLALAERFGAQATISIADFPNAKDRVEEVTRLSGGGGADVVIEMAGVPAVVAEGIDYLRPGGRYVLIGKLLAEATAEIVPQRIVRAGKQLIGVVNYERWILPRTLAWLGQKQDVYPFGELVSEVFPLERLTDAVGASDWAGSRAHLGRAIISMQA